MLHLYMLLAQATPTPTPIPTGIYQVGDVLGWIQTILKMWGVWDLLGVVISATLLLSATFMVIRRVAS